MCVAFFLMVCPETKASRRPNSLMENKEAVTVTVSAYKDQVNAGFCLYIYNLRLQADQLYIFNMTLNKTNWDWLLQMSLRCPLGRSLVSESCRPSAISLKVWLCESTVDSKGMIHPRKEHINISWFHDQTWPQTPDNWGNQEDCFILIHLIICTVKRPRWINGSVVFFLHHFRWQVLSFPCSYSHRSVNKFSKHQLGRLA